MEENKDEILQEEDDEIITLTFDDGVKQNFYNIAELDYKGRWYIYLQPKELDDDFEEDEVIIYEMTEDEDGNEVFLPIEDENLIEELVQELNNAVKE
ncbi:MAG: DUF1292 domain-containing protein [Clostridia bacterium]